MRASSLPMTENQLTPNQRVAIPSDAGQISFQNPAAAFSSALVFEEIQMSLNVRLKAGF
jgi:hypothetical protein